MATYQARRGNKVLKISEDYIDRYLGQGYTITDMGGNVVKQGIPHDINALSAEVKKQMDEITNLKTKLDATLRENEALKAELDKFKSMPITESKPRKRRQVTEQATETDTIIEE